MITSVDSAAIFNHALLWGGEGFEGADALSAEGVVGGAEGGESPTEVRQPQGATRGSEAVPQILPLHTEMLGLDSSGPPPGAEALPEGDQTSLEMLMQSVNSVGKDSGRGRSGGSSADSGNSGNADTPDETAPLPGKPSVGGSGSSGSETIIFEQGGVGAIQFLLDLLQYDTKREQINGSINQLQADSTQFQMTMEEKIQKLEEKISGQDARLASKIFMWVALVLGAVVSAFTMGAMSGPIALIAGAIGLAVAVYSLSQQVASEVSDGDYFPGQEWTMMLEACGLDEATAQTAGPIMNGAMQAALSILSGGMGIYAAFNVVGTGFSLTGAWSAKLARVGFGAEAASVITDGGVGASSVVVSTIDLQNGLTDAELQLLDAVLKQMGLTRDQLVAYLQFMMQSLDELVSTVMTIFQSWQQTNSKIAKSPSMM